MLPESHKRRFIARHASMAKVASRQSMMLPGATALLLLMLCVHTLLSRQPAAVTETHCSWPPPARVFLHMHKTAGNNLKVALTGFARRNGLRLWHTCHPAEADSPLERLYFARDAKPADATDCNLKPFSRLSHNKRRDYDLISGHQYLGAHTLVRPRATRYFTFMRHPLQRKVSHYTHFELSPVLRANSTTPLLRAERPRLARYLLHKNLNYMTKRLAGASSSEIMADIRSRLIDNNRFVARAALRAAQTNLHTRFFFVGLQERYAESLCVLAHQLNSACYASIGRRGHLRKKLRFGQIAASNINRRAVSQLLLDSMSDNLGKHTLIAEQLDLQLYNFAVDLFQKQLERFPQCKGVNG